jgi:biopolymer transport protein ExbD
MRMALALARGSQMSDMNVTPLVDVMLVLLIIFMVTVPMVDYTKDLGIAPSPPPTTITPEPLRVHIGAGDTYTLDGQPVSIEQLQARFAVAARLGFVGDTIDPMRQPAVELAIEPDAEYASVALVLSRANNARLQRIGFAR